MNNFRSNRSKSCFIALLHFNGELCNTPNIAGKSAEIYLPLLRRLISSTPISQEWVIFSNNSCAVERYMPELFRGRVIMIRESSVDYALNTSIRFYAAHAKLNMIKDLSLINGFDQFVFFDLDIAILNLDRLYSFLDYSSYFGLTCIFNIYDQILCADTDLVALKSLNHKIWVGGEFFVLNNESLLDIKNAIDGVIRWYAFLANKDSLDHIGDEAVLSYCFNSLKGVINIKIILPSDDFIQRYWSVPVSHKRKYKEYFVNDVALLHLPADKKFMIENEVFYRYKFYKYIINRYIKIIYKRILF